MNEQANDQASDAQNSPANGTELYDRNVEAIAAFIESGCITGEGALGIELEHIIVREDGSPVNYSGEDGIQSVLEVLRADYPQATYDAEGDLLGVARPGEAITIEPAAQVELSAGPFRNLADAQTCFGRFESKLEGVLAGKGAKLAKAGYHPTARATSLELIPKQRYEYMNRYLGAVSPFGPCMMRGSASTQVSIDYTSVDDCVRKYRVASALTPILSLIGDNSPIFEGAPRTHRMVRTEIWQHCDPERCGIVPGAVEGSFTLRDYARWVYDTPAILVPDGQGGWREDSRRFSEIYATRPMNRADIEHALSMVFPDVRLKTYLEIRPADALPVPYAVAYAALVKGIFYCEESLACVEGLIAGVTTDDIECAKNSLQELGYEGEMYGMPASGFADEVMAAARSGLTGGERGFLEPLEKLVAARTTLADVGQLDF